MGTDMEFSGSLLDGAFWDQCLEVLLVLAGALFLLTLAPPLVIWVLRPSRKPSAEGNAPGEPEAPAGAATPDAPAGGDRPVAQRGGLARVQPASAQERRKDPRREGSPTPVLLSLDAD